MAKSLTKEEKKRMRQLIKELQALLGMRGTAVLVVGGEFVYIGPK